MKLNEILRRDIDLPDEVVKQLPRPKKKYNVKRTWKRMTGNKNILYLGTDAVTPCSTSSY